MPVNGVRCLAKSQGSCTITERLRLRIPAIQSVVTLTLSPFALQAELCV